MVNSISSNPAAYPANTARKQPSVYQAQADSAKADADAAALAEQNAAGVASLAAKGFTLTVRSFAGDYKDKVLAGVDKDQDHMISAAELDSQVQAGGGSAQDTAALYAAMDMDKDGKVTAKEFEDSLPDPFSSAAFIKRLNSLVAKDSTKPADVMALYRAQADSDSTPALLAGLAKQLVP